MILTPLLIMILLFILEGCLVRRYRRQIPLVIHVNGTRGKSTIVRMLDEVFRACGYKTVSKVTGTVAAWRNVRGVEQMIRRTQPNVREQKRILKQAAREGAEVLIVECMALSPDMQRYSETLLQADWAVISNVKSDHLEVMGSRRAAIAETMLAMARRDQPILVGDSFLIEEFGTRYPRMILAGEHKAIAREFRNNTDIVKELAEQLQLHRGACHAALERYRPDPGAFRILYYKKNRIHAAFSANDLESTTELYRTYRRGGDNLFWFNDRPDRPLRSRMFLKWMSACRPSHIILSGGRYGLNRRRLRRFGYKGPILRPLDFRDEDRDIFGLGNIRGMERCLKLS